MQSSPKTSTYPCPFQADQLPDNYTGHLKLCQAFFKLRLQRDVEILDVSAHVSCPGLVGRELQASLVTSATHF